MTDETSAATHVTDASDDADVAMVLRAYEGFERGEIEAAVANLHDEVEWTEPDSFPGGGRRHGPAAVADYLRASREHWAELTSHRTAYRRGADIVVVHHVTGRLHDGTLQDVTVADVFTVKDGQVLRMQAYADPADALG